MYEAKERANTVSRRIGMFAFAAAMIGAIFSIGGVPAFHWWLACFMVALAVHSLVYAYIFTTAIIHVPYHDTAVSHDDPTSDDNDTAVMQSTSPAQSATVRQPQSPVALWQTGYFKADERRMLRIPSDVNSDHLAAIFTAVANGRLHDGLSPNRLDAEKIVSRNTEAPNAYTVVEFLVRAGILKDNGERRMYTWTAAGEQLFNLPHPVQAQNHTNRSRVPEVTRPDSTATTAYATALGEVVHV